IPVIPVVPAKVLIVPADPLVAPEVGAVSVISPTGVLDLMDYSSFSDSDPSKDFLPLAPERVSHRSSDRHSSPEFTSDLSSSGSSSGSSSDTSSGSPSDSLSDSSSVHSLGYGASPRLRFILTEDSRKEHMEIGTTDIEAIADLGIGDRVGARTEDGIGMGVKVAASDIREDDEEFEAEASVGGTIKIAIDPLVTGEVPLDRITEFETAQRQLEVGQLVTSGERAGLVDRIRRTMTNTRSGMTTTAIEEMINRCVAKALEAHEANKNIRLGNDNDEGSNGNGDGNGNGNHNENDRVISMDKTKNHKKTIKNGQTRIQERKSVQEPEAKVRKVNPQGRRTRVQGHHIIKHSHWLIPTKNDTVEERKAQGKGHFTLNLHSEEAHKCHITDCQAGNPCVHKFDPTANYYDPMIGKSYG
ncbi:hypothetical protein Tco_1007230, partial [Tanacetum coccineum]